MKKILFTVGLFVLCAISGFAEEWTDLNGITWTYSMTEGGLVLQGASGYGESFSVPSQINGQDVVYIEGDAFKGCPNLAGGFIYNGIKYIGQKYDENKTGANMFSFPE